MGHLASGPRGSARLARRDVAPALADYLRREPPRPSPRNTLGRLLETKQPVHTPDFAAELVYAERQPLRVAAKAAGINIRLGVNVHPLIEQPLRDEQASNIIGAKEATRT